MLASCIGSSTLPYLFGRQPLRHGRFVLDVVFSPILPSLLFVCPAFVITHPSLITSS